MNYTFDINQRDDGRYGWYIFRLINGKKWLIEEGVCNTYEETCEEAKQVMEEIWMYKP